ncbi:signal recognition particle-docking protein FtsY [Azotobacter chroococcum subsp. isscasi]|uniref:signal recognition particle-docking protein FtsY n=1 Tax=Azotobacter chroococcum TaxID=353 RepID=UPI00103EEE60|nr:signal recognition particle-docking protein FtsY [Azotobacter chroococcum]TBW07054.1 signal recognition particle-docking protein FtsY [Azotobacter chroococcum subsp. isscasi]
MFGSNDDKKPAEAGEKKGLFGWFRKKEQSAPAPVPEEAAPEAGGEPSPAEEAAEAARPAEPEPQPAQVEVPAPVVEAQPESPAVASSVPEVAEQAPAAPEEEVVFSSRWRGAAHGTPAPAAEAAPVSEPEPLPAVEAEPAVPVAQPAPRPNKSGFFARLRQGLAKTGSNLGEGMASLFLGEKAIDDELLEELETRLLLADVGVEATTAIIQSLTQRVARKELADSEALYRALQEELTALLKPVEQPLALESAQRPYVILVVGVNGAGKTTTIGKLAARLQQDGKKVMLAAGDTFRAAAVEQLQVWGERNRIPVIAQHTGADSASVIFDALQAAKARGMDVLIADTAGRLHTKDNLMEELRKVRRVLGKLDDAAPHEVLLVLDAGTGQNAINQTKQFNQAVEVTGLALTKLDGTAKGGVIFALAKQFGLPIRYIGVGEGVDDLRTFVAEEFVRALFAEKPAQ